MISVDTVDRMERLHTLSGHSARVMALAFSGDGVYLASSSIDRTIKLWEVRSGLEVHSLDPGKCAPVAFSPDGSWLPVAPINQPIKF